MQLIKLLFLSFFFMNGYVFSLSTDSSLSVHMLLNTSNSKCNQLEIDFTRNIGDFKPDISFSDGTSTGNINNPEFWTSLGNNFHALNPHFMRINIFDVLPIKDSGEVITIDWSIVDSSINKIKSIGAKPFITLFPTPTINGNEKYVRVPCYTNDEWWDKYKIICQKISEHLSNINGLNLPGLYYEVWNEPEGFWMCEECPADTSIKWKLYNRLYKNAAEGIFLGDNAAKIGGPTACFPQAIEPFLIEYVKEPSHLDFVSWHRYNGDKQFLYYDRTIAENLLKKYNVYHTDMSFIISEYNIDGLDYHNSTTNDGMNDAFYNAGNLAMTQSFFRKDSKLFGLFFLPRDNYNITNYYNGWGAFTAGNLPKPAYNFFWLYSRMQGTEVEVTEKQSKIKAWASKNGSKYRILFWSYLPTGPFGSQLKTKVLLKNIPAGHYIQQSYLIDSKHGNFKYDLQANISAPGELKMVEKSVILSGNVDIDYKMENGAVELIEFVPVN